MKRSRAIWIYFLLLLIIIIGALSIIFYFVPIDKNVKAKGSVVPKTYQEVKAKVSGIIQEVYVREGESVEQGDKLALIDDKVLQERKNNLIQQKEEIQDDIDRWEERLNSLEIRIHPSENMRIDEKINQAERDKVWAERKLSLIEELSKDELVSKIDREEAEWKVKSSESLLKQLEEEKNLLLGQQMNETEDLKTQISQRRELLEAVIKNLAILEKSLENVTIIAPCRGIVLTYEVHKKKGSYVAEGGPFMEIGDKENLVFKAKVDGKDISEVRIGDPAKIFLNTFPKRKYHPLEGSVDHITEISAKEPGSPFYVVIPLNKTFYKDEDEPEGQRKEVKPGYAGEAEILVDEDSTIFDNILDSLLK